MNRPVTASVSSDSVNFTTLFNNYYDAQASGTCASYGSLVTVTGARQYVATGVTYRGNLTHAYNPLTNTTACAQYDTTGNSPQQLDALNRTHTATFGSTTNYAVPSATALGVYTDSMTWNTFLGLTQDTRVNNVTTNLQYDSYARPTQTTAPTGAVTTYTYTVSPPTVTATTNGRWVKTTLDGLGRALKVETGYSSTTVSIVDYEYDSCGCSPIGKLKRQSLPYAPGGSVKWTTYNYDGLGRTISVVAPDTASTSTYSYAGNTVTVTDPAGKWKKMTYNVFGQITKVTEPNPGGGTWDTTYTYNKFNQLTQVQQIRNGEESWNVAFEFGPAAVGIIIGAGAAGEAVGVWCARNPACVATVGATVYVAFHNLAKLLNVFESRSSANQRENDQFKEAVRRYEKSCGRALSDDEKRRLHDAISGQGYTIDEIVADAEAIFGCPVEPENPTPGAERRGR